MRTGARRPCPRRRRIMTGYTHTRSSGRSRHHRRRGPHRRRDPRHHPEGGPTLLHLLRLLLHLLGTYWASSVPSCDLTETSPHLHSAGPAAFLGSRRLRLLHRHQFYCYCPYYSPTQFSSCLKGECDLGGSGHTSYEDMWTVSRRVSVRQSSFQWELDLPVRSSG